MKNMKYLKIITLVLLLVISLFWFVFALLSGAEEGIIKNSPNALPALILLIATYLSYKKPLIGGIIIAILGIITMFFFDAFEEIAVLFIISLPLIILGGLLISSYYLKKTKK